MKISDILKNGKPTLSFEVFPPKTESNFESVKRATEAVAEGKPDFMSVTYGAGGSTSNYTLEIAENLLKRGVTPIAHLTCVCSTKESILQRLQAFQKAGIENIMALRGDVPKEPSVPQEQWEYAHANELMRTIKEFDSDFCIGGACYPEVHPESTSRREDIKHLKDKVDCGCDFLTTQMFFDNNILFNFLYHLREAGVEVPVLAGIMPVTKAAQLKRIMSISGTQLPQRFKAIIDRFGENPAAMEQAGIAYATDQIIDLYANGIEHVHIYTMNNPFVAKKIMENLSVIIGK